MHNRDKKVLIIGLGNPLAPFILRRLHKLATGDMALIIVCQANAVNTFKNLPAVKVIPYYKFEGFSMRLSLLAIFKVMHWPKLWKHAPGISFRSKLRWLIENCQWLYIPQPDVVHLQWLSPYYRYHWLAWYFKNVPVVVSVRGSQATVAALTDPAATEMLAVNFHHADCIHCVSNDIANHCCALGAPPEKLFVNYNGINLSKYKPDVLKPASKTLRIISVGALIWRKGYLYQLQVMKELTSQGVEASLCIIGSGADEAGLKYTAHRLGVDGQVFFEGQKNQDEIISKLQASDVYLATSAAEGLPNSLVEAAACGLPIVTFACEGAHEIIEQNVTGYVVEFGLVGELVNKIVALQNESLRKSMGALARGKMEKEFNEDYWVNEMISRYNQITSHAR